MDVPARGNAVQKNAICCSVSQESSHTTTRSDCSPHTPAADRRARPIALHIRCAAGTAVYISALRKCNPTPRNCIRASLDKAADYIEASDIRDRLQLRRPCLCRANPRGTARARRGGSLTGRRAFRRGSRSRYQGRWCSCRRGRWWGCRGLGCRGNWRHRGVGAVEWVVPLVVEAVGAAREDSAVVQDGWVVGWTLCLGCSWVMLVWNDVCARC
jgi:hypothetical protein